MANIKPGDKVKIIGSQYSVDPRLDVGNTGVVVRPSTFWGTPGFIVLMDNAERNVFQDGGYNFGADQLEVISG